MNDGSGAADAGAIAAAEAYESALVRRVFGPWAERAVAIAAPKPGEAVLDAPCGTGIGVRLAAPHVRPGGRLTGLDIDPGMLAVARRLAEEAGVEAEWHRGDLAALPFEDRAFDLCLALQGPQFASDPAAALGEMRRVLKADGRLVASLWGPLADNKGHHAVAQALERLGIAPALKPFSLGDLEKAETLVRAAGFRDLRVESESRPAAFPSVEAFIEGLAAGAPATRHAIAKLAEAYRAAFVEDVKRTLAPYRQAGGLELPTRFHIILAGP
ncbi:MAG TPA: methyltransferase domain-containing protein [Kiloniellales bacterium]|nr:methyltransferase domain-containing protein [Kiloniellales bacterium]